MLSVFTAELVPFSVFALDITVSLLTSAPFRRFRSVDAGWTLAISRVLSESRASIPVEPPAKTEPDFVEASVLEETGQFVDVLMYVQNVCDPLFP